VPAVRRRLAGERRVCDARHLHLADFDRRLRQCVADLHGRAPLSRQVIHFSLSPLQ
jgi:hypothetical protein